MILGLIAYWTPHHDSVTSLAVCERMEKTLIISASSDFCVILSDIKGSQKWLFQIPIACNTCRHWTWGCKILCGCIPVSSVLIFQIEESIYSFN